MKVLKTPWDLTITCCLQSNHGPSGHLFEIIEYFLFLREHGYDCGMLIPFELTPEQFRNALDKYVLSTEELADISKRTLFNTGIRLLKCSRILFVDGLISYRKDVILDAEEVIMFRCALDTDADKADLVLQDERLYSDFTRKSAHYVKKILFSKLKIPKNPQGIAYVHATRQCRELTKDTIDALGRLPYKEILIGSERPYPNLPENCTNVELPMKNFYDRFGAFIYTPVGGFCPGFDCSPRLPAECKYFGKEFVLMSPLYRGLDVRLHDCEHLDVLDLSKDDRLLRLI